jgi:hypothetical protein
MCLNLTEHWRCFLCFLFCLPHTNNSFFIVDYIIIPFTGADQPIYLQNFFEVLKIHYELGYLNIAINQMMFYITNTQCAI